MIKITYSSKKLSPTHLGSFYRPYKYLPPALQSRSEKINLSLIHYFRPLTQLFHGKREITGGYIGMSVTSGSKSNVIRISAIGDSVAITLGA